VMMFNNMLRDEFGDEVFIQAYADFYIKNKFRFASWNDIRSSFEEHTGEDLGSIFEQWINRKGAPSLELSKVMVSGDKGKYELSFSLAQVQEDFPFQLAVPVAIYLEDEVKVHLTREVLDEKEATFTYQFSNRPLKVSIDPQFNLMRQLDRSEVPSTLSQLFGAKETVMILPRDSKISAQYLELAKLWKATQEAQNKSLKILYDSELDALPTDAATWILGFENRYFDQVRISKKYRDFLTNEENEKIATLTKENSLVYAVPGLNDPGQTIGFIGTNQVEAIKGLARKLPHYGSYGYLGFEGEAPDNILKGIFPILDSKLDHIVSYPDQPEVKQKLAARKALDP